MTLDEYQKAAASTAIYPGQGEPGWGLAYCVLGLAGESGEVAELLKKAIRDEAGGISPERKAKFVSELGDLTWYVANALKELGVSMDECAQGNIDKLASRQARGVLTGSGSDR